MAAETMACPLFVPNGQALLIALSLFCLQNDFFSFISYLTLAGNEYKYHYVILKP